MESFYSLLKKEEINNHNCIDSKDAYKSIFELYNPGITIDVFTVLYRVKHPKHFIIPKLWLLKLSKSVHFIDTTLKLPLFHHMSIENFKNE